MFRFQCRDGAHSRNGCWTVEPSGLQLREDSLQVAAEGAAMALLAVGCIATFSRVQISFQACSTLLIELLLELQDAAQMDENESPSFELYTWKAALKAPGSCAAGCSPSPPLHVVFPLA